MKHSKALAILTVIILVSSAVAEGQQARHGSRIVIEGQADGGVLKLANTYSRDPIIFRVETKEGESPEAVAVRLASEFDPQLQQSHPNIPVRPVNYMLEGNVIRTSWFRFINEKQSPGFVMGGTDRGINILPAPRDFSAFYDSERDGYVFAWSLPVDSDGMPIQYDKLLLSEERSPPSAVPIPLEPRSTSSFQPLARLLDGTAAHGESSRFAVLSGVVGDIPSAPAILVLEPRKTVMSEDANTIYHFGVMPNWWIWHERSASIVDAREAIHARDEAPVSRNYSTHVEPSYQKVSVPEGTGGIARGVLTELDGVYRPFIQLRIPSELQEESDWEISVSATPIAKEDRDLLPRWNKSGKIDASLNRPFAVYNASSTNRYDEWIGVTPVSPLALKADDSAGFLVTVSMRGTGDHMIGIDGFSVHHNP